MVLSSSARVVPESLWVTRTAIFMESVPLRGRMVTERDSLPLGKVTEPEFFHSYRSSDPSVPSGKRISTTPSSFSAMDSGVFSENSGASTRTVCFCDVPRTSPCLFLASTHKDKSPGLVAVIRFMTSSPRVRVICVFGSVSQRNLGGGFLLTPDAGGLRGYSTLGEKDSPKSTSSGTSKRVTVKGPAVTLCVADAFFFAESLTVTLTLTSPGVAATKDASGPPAVTFLLQVKV